MKTITERWEEGIDHHPAAAWLARKIGDYDFKHNSDASCYKFGGDGDNGEDLCYLLSMIFENKRDIEQFKKILG